MSGTPAEARLDAVDPDPLRQFSLWLLEEEAAAETLPAEAMALATATAGGAPSLRTVLLRGFDERGFVFYTSYESRKARELAENPRAALLFHWPRIGRQVRVEGPVERVPRELSEAYFARRPRGHQLAAWASRQSSPVTRDELEAAVAELQRRFAGADVPLPPAWGGYLVVPEAYEFWQHRLDRLHDRWAYARTADGAWTATRLAP